MDYWYICHILKDRFAKFVGGQGLKISKIVQILKKNTPSDAKHIQEI